MSNRQKITWYGSKLTFNNSKLTWSDVTTSSSLLNGLVSYYPFNGNSIDSVGRQDGINNGNFTFSNGGKISPQYAYINSGYTEISSNGMGTFNNENYTISAWVRLEVPDGTPNDRGGIMNMFDYGYDNINMNWHNTWCINQGGMDVSAIESCIKNTQSMYYTHNISPIEYVWKLYTIVVNSTSMKYYLNGGLVDTRSGYTYQFGYDNTPVRIGYWHHQWIGVWSTGDICEWGYWDRVLTSTEISKLYNGGIGNTYPFITPAPVDPSQVLYFPMDDTSQIKPGTGLVYSDTDFFYYTFLTGSTYFTQLVEGKVNNTIDSFNYTTQTSNFTQGDLLQMNTQNNLLCFNSGQNWTIQFYEKRGLTTELPTNSRSNFVKLGAGFHINGWSPTNTGTEAVPIPLGSNLVIYNYGYEPGPTGFTFVWAMDIPKFRKEYAPWVLVDIVRSGDTLNIYTDSVLVASNSNISGLDYLNDMTIVELFGEQGFSAMFLWGSIDEFRIFNRALTPSEMTTYL